MIRAPLGASMCRLYSLWRLIAALCCVAVFTAATVQPVSASPRETYRLVVVGDSLGDGIWIGLKRILRNDSQFSILKRSRVSTGFARPDFYDWNEALPRVLSESRPDMVVVIMGTNDQQPMRVGDSRARVLSDEWRAIYVERANKFAAVLAERGVPTYWVGLPIMRAPDFARGVERLNGIFRDIASRYGHTYIDTWQDFADDKGKYSTYGPDLDGRTRKLRAGDGVHFTMRGYERFAKPVADLIMRDVRHRRMVRTAQSGAQVIGHGVADAMRPAAPPIPVMRDASHIPQVLSEESEKQALDEEGVAATAHSTIPPIPVMRPNRSSLFRLRDGFL